MAGAYYAFGVISLLPAIQASGKGGWQSEPAKPKRDSVTLEDGTHLEIDVWRIDPAAHLNKKCGVTVGAFTIAEEIVGN